jgi:hypothetical protein
MLDQPGIFTVHVFRLEDGGKRRLQVHYVAGTSSADAEARIKASNASRHLAGQCFITTDEHEALHGDGCKLYTTRFRNEDDIDSETLRRWARSHTRASVEDGDYHPAAFRRFHVPFARAARPAGGPPTM